MENLNNKKFRKIIKDWEKELAKSLIAKDVILEKDVEISESKSQNKSFVNGNSNFRFNFPRREWGCSYFDTSEDFNDK